MDNKLLKILIYFTLTVVSITLFFWGVFTAKTFLAPLTVGALLTMVVLPVSNWLEKKGILRGFAAFFSTLIILSFFIIISGVVAWQVNNFSEDWPEIKERITPKIEQLQEFIGDKTGISPQEQKEKILGYQKDESLKNSDSTDNGSSSPKPESSSVSGSAKAEQTNGDVSGMGGSVLKSAGGYAMSFFNVMGNFLLTFIYLFFFLLYRRKFSNSLLKMTPDNQREKTKVIICESVLISQNYLFGRLLLILFLAIIYSIGLSISGVEQAILISVLAAVLSLMPYIGNVVGYGLAVSMAFISGSGLGGLVGVTITFAVAQFVESYILEPYVVGDKVNINPVFTILVVVLGGAIWGVIGMLIAIPALGIVKVVFDQIPSLQPLGYLFGEEDIGDDDGKPGVFEKIKNWATDQFSNKI